MKTISYYFLHYNSFILISLFMLSFRKSGSWETAFIVAGAYSFFHVILAYSNRYEIDSLFLSFEVFLIGGLLMSTFHLPLLENLYSRNMESTLFLAAIVTGIFLTLFSKQGFINSEKPTRFCVARRSLLLVGCSVIAYYISWSYRGHFIYSAVMPFVFLKFAKSFLQKNYPHHAP